VGHALGHARNIGGKPANGLQPVRTRRHLGDSQTTRTKRAVIANVTGFQGDFNNRIFAQMFRQARTVRAYPPDREQEQHRNNGPEPNHNLNLTEFPAACNRARQPPTSPASAPTTALAL